MTKDEQEELEDLVARMNQVAEQTYNLFFHANMGGDVHAFIEFNGLITKYVDVCRRAASEGIDFRLANEHNGIALPVEAHDLNYFAEKLRCILGPMIDANPKAKAAFIRKLSGAE